jgi:small-conductance mechanosensitive channel
MLRSIIFISEVLFMISFLFFRDNPLVLDIEDLHPTLFVIGRYLVFVAFIDAIRRAIQFWYAKKYQLLRTNKANFQYGINNIANVVLVLGTIVHLFQLFGIDIKTLLTSMSIVAAAIAIITKDYITDFLVGLYFSFSKNFEINDYVKMGEFRGKIIELQIFKVRLLNDDDDSILIPNSKIYNTEITNYTRRDIRLMSVDFELGVMNISTIEQLESDLINSLQDLIEFIEPGTFSLRIVEMRKDAVDMKFQCKMKQFDRDLQRQVRKKTVRQVFNYIASKVKVGETSEG